MGHFTSPHPINPIHPTLDSDSVSPKKPQTKASYATTKPNYVPPYKKPKYPSLTILCRVISNEIDKETIKVMLCFRICLFEYSHMEFNAERGPPGADDPSLADMTRAALSILSKNDKGFFLFIEAVADRRVRLLSAFMRSILNRHKSNEAQKKRGTQASFSVAAQIDGKVSSFHMHLLGLGLATSSTCTSLVLEMPERRVQHERALSQTVVAQYHQLVIIIKEVVVPVCRSGTSWRRNENRQRRVKRCSAGRARGGSARLSNDGCGGMSDRELEPRSHTIHETLRN
ncbi:Intestinal-type alkaline phosphatase 2 [Eumeta japonica]|uniref:alkaline phosphatase n=1 Tax=Eumeta variegata TaxID=151549 RepID=A0A4C1X064_EUMVA|nr:Intestinal-type alkaline phosphatase 2 [Eumeta japonica]